MTRTLTLTDLLAMSPCNRDACIAMFNGQEALNAQQAFDSGCAVDDMVWLLGRLRMTDVVVEFAEWCAHAAAAARAADDTTDDAIATYAARAAAHAAAAAAYAARADATARHTARAAQKAKLTALINQRSN